jgi:prepilin-type N-terminal cleavage/methylation domain-containing protein
MKTSHQAQNGFTLIELLVVIAIIAILAALAVPQITSALMRGQMVQTVNNEKQIYLAVFNMANDYAVSQDPKLGWPGDLAISTDSPITNLTEFVKRLEKYDYIKQADVGKIFAAPGIRAYTGTGEFSSENSAFKIYKVKDADVSNCLFAATKNYTFNQGLDAGTSPYADKGFVVIRKGGDATAYYNKQSALNKNIGFMPGSSTQESPGTESNANTWK